MKKTLAIALIMAAAAGCGKSGGSGGPAPTHAKEALAPKYTAKPVPVEEKWVKINFKTPPETFLFHQENVSVSKGADETKRHRKMTIDGQLTAKPMVPANIKPGSPARGHLLFDNLEVVQEMSGPGLPAKNTKGPMPPFIVRAIGVNGEGLEKAGGQGGMMNVILPLPGRPLKTGDTATRKIILPLSMNGIPLPVEALQTITMGGEVNLNGVKALVVTQTIENASYTMPENITGKLDITCQGTGTTYFEEATGAPLESEAAFRMTLKGKIQKQLKIKDNPQGTVQKTEHVEMDSDNFFTLKRSRK